ncbi:MAG: L-lactate dehydrogenase [Mahellales bacterium]
MEYGYDTGKVTIIGAGMVGATAAYALMMGHVVSEIALVDIDEERVEGEVMDLNHGVSFVPHTRVKIGDYGDCADSNIIIITAGVAQKPGQTRLDLVVENTRIYKEIIPRIISYTRDAILLIVTNPVDILTYVALKISGLPEGQVIGSGTVLDSSRFRYLLSQHCKVNVRNVHGYIIGEHGDSEVAVWSLANIAGTRVDDYCPLCGGGCEEGYKDGIYKQVRDSAYHIIDAKGSTYYAVGLAISRIVESIIMDENSVLTVSTLMKGYYGVEDVCLSLPCIMNSKGVDKVLNLPLNSKEINAFRDSAEKLKDTIQNVVIDLLA